MDLVPWLSAEQCTAIGTLGAALAAAIACYQAKRSGDQADKTSATMLRLEHRREYAALTPEVRARITKESGNVRLFVMVEGPAALGAHEIRVRPVIRNVVPGHDEDDRQVWGPWEFAADGSTTTDRRRPDPRLFHLCRPEPYALNSTTPPHSGDRDSWLRNWGDVPMRLVVEVSTADHEWKVPVRAFFEPGNHHAPW